MQVEADAFVGVSYVLMGVCWMQLVLSVRLQPSGLLEAKLEITVAKYRKSGLDIVEDIAWDIHICQFYKTKQYLIDVLVLTA